MLAATAAFKLSAQPFMGIVTFSTQAASIAAGSPSPSFPMQSARGRRVQSNAL